MFGHACDLFRYGKEPNRIKPPATRWTKAAAEAKEVARLINERKTELK
jgi:hypothetical protein